MIKIQNIQKSFNSNTVLKSIDLEVKDGEVVVIIGPSGTGKSTFLRCLNYLERPDKGIITIGEITVDAEKTTESDIHKLRKKTSMVFQGYNLFKNRTVLENLMEALVVVKKVSKKDAEVLARQALEQVGLSDKVEYYPKALSGGQQQRVGIARAMVVNPEVMLFDEPTSALDPELVGEVFEVIKSLAKKHITMIIVTHEMNFAKEVADKVVFMEGGKIVEVGTPKEIFEESNNQRIKQFINKVNK
ncbi:amino acid ABC transporter ATP-binding protein [Clostridium frigidicarnis]|uniref:Amino acid ABC transporter ATP-binding protein, PAAT family n=1 Tax=Clostridium frigidicarnis TaxID=84698 RepID=A0A1I0V7W3_9CLOT|nr:amino acid ABC transporter ATP-binding protein [Clostridium frigidicarnis]SFA72449.1 amino acid ABC transporter ATP-binding protein, PAAT family [Clostridium frigidicarnis]